jgi:HSP20 family protein
LPPAEDAHKNKLSTHFLITAASTPIEPQQKECLKMAEVDVRKQSPEQQRNASNQSVERSRQSVGLQRRGAYPSLFSLSPAEFFNANPFSLMRRFTDEMDRMFEGFGGTRGNELRQWSPAVEVRERDGKLEVYADLPGIKENDVKVEVTDEGLVIQGERRSEHEENREGLYRSERSYGQFYRLIPLPETANIDQARAEFRNGELRITMPVSEQQRKGRQIPISTAAGDKKEAASQTSGSEQARRAG